jgi:Bacterial extracellular solute-binding protein, family 7
VGNHYVDSAKYVTANLDLWPRPQVIITSPATLASLSTEQRHALQRAVVVARPVAEQTARKEDRTSAASLCRDGMTMKSASAEELRVLTDALAPVFDELVAEPGTRPWLEQIRSLKNDLAVPADTQTCGGQSAATVATPIPDGTYRREAIKGEAVPGCPPNTDLTDARSYFLLKLKQGSITLYSPSSAPGAAPEVGWVGTYRVFRDRVDFTEASTGIVLSTAWQLDGRRLTLSDLEGGACGDANVWTVAPWYKGS